MTGQTFMVDGGVGVSRWAVTHVLGLRQHTGDVAESSDLQPEALAKLDADYRSFPAADEWPQPIGIVDLWDVALERLKGMRSISDPETVDEVVREALRVAAIDTGAIEGLYETGRGFTFSVAAMAATWEQELVETKGPDVALTVKAQLAGLESALDLATGHQPISEAWIRGLHQVICANQETYEVRTPAGPMQRTLPRGSYKANPNHVLQADGTTHSYAPVADTPFEVRRFVTELRSEAFERLHPVAQAAYAHYAFVSIHPFADGNGRVARAIASIFLLRAASIPFTVLSEQKGAYLDALEAVDDGDRTALTKFAWDRGYEVMAFFTQELAARAQDPSAVLAELDAIVRADPSPQRRLDLIAERLASTVEARTRAVINELDDAEGVHASFKRTSSGSERVTSWRPIAGADRKGILLRFTIDNPIPAVVQDVASVLIETEPRASFEFVLIWQRGGETLEARMDEIEPNISTMLVRRIDPWIRRAVGRMLRELRDEAVGGQSL